MTPDLFTDHQFTRAVEAGCALEWDPGRCVRRFPEAGLLFQSLMFLTDPDVRSKFFWITHRKWWKMGDSPLVLLRKRDFCLNSYR